MAFADQYWKDYRCIIFSGSHTTFVYEKYTKSRPRLIRSRLQVATGILGYKLYAEAYPLGNQEVVPIYTYA